MLAGRSAGRFGGGEDLQLGTVLEVRQVLMMFGFLAKLTVFS